MSIIKFELTENNVKLLKNLRWSIKDKAIIGLEDEKEIDNPKPFGEDNLYEAIDTIINGKPVDFDPLNTYEERVFDEAQIEQFDELYNGLPTALEIILTSGSFELGTYRAKFHERIWKKIV